MRPDFTFEDIKNVITEALEERPVSPWLGTARAAHYLGCKYGTLKTWRGQGKGPRYHIVSSNLVRYHVDDLDAFVRGEVVR